YDGHAEDLELVSHLNLDMYLDQRKLDWEKWKLVATLDKAAMIAVGSVPDVQLSVKSKEKVTLTGPRDALKFLYARVSEGVLLDKTRSVGGDTATDGAASTADRISAAAQGWRNVIPTHTPIDRAMDVGPGATIKYVGLLGFSNQRKSTLLFTLAYQAAAAGYKVLFVPRECSTEDAWDRIVWLHAHTIGRGRELPALANMRDPAFAHRHHPKIVEEIGKDMEARGIRIRVEALGDFGSIKACVEAHVEDPYDMLCVDYLGHLETPGFKQKLDGLMETFRSAQQLTQDYEE